MDNLVKQTLCMPQEVTLIVLGMSGHGKSTFANKLTGDQNLFKTGEGYKAVTSSTELKEYKDEDGFLYNIIDTPGFGDNRGDEQEKQNTEGIYKFIGESPKRIQTVLIIIEFFQEKMNQIIKESLKKICHMFPIEDFWDHVIIIWTKYKARTKEAKEKKRKLKEDTFLETMDDIFTQLKEEKGVKKPEKLKMFFMEKNEPVEEYNLKLKAIKDEVKKCHPLFKKIYDKENEQKEKVGEPILTGNVITQDYRLQTLRYFIDFDDNIKNTKVIKEKTWKETTKLLEHTVSETKEIKNGKGTTYTVYRKKIIFNEDDNKKERMFIDFSNILKKYTIVETKMKEIKEIKENETKDELNDILYEKIRYDTYEITKIIDSREKGFKNNRKLINSSIKNYKTVKKNEINIKPIPSKNTYSREKEILNYKEKNITQYRIKYLVDYEGKETEISKNLIDKWTEIYYTERFSETSAPRYSGYMEYKTKTTYERKVKIDRNKGKIYGRRIEIYTEELEEDHTPEEYVIYDYEKEEYERLPSYNDPILFGLIDRMKHKVEVYKVKYEVTNFGKEREVKRRYLRSYIVDE